jgi:hypothetical protein
MALTDIKVKTAKNTNKPYKLTDGGGMYLLVNPNGSKYWQYRFRLNSKQGTYQIGSYPDFSLNPSFGFYPKIVAKFDYFDLF